MSFIVAGNELGRIAITDIGRNRRVQDERRRRLVAAG
jgi:hypothetical protein